MQKLSLQTNESALRIAAQCYLGTFAFLVGLGATAVVVGARGAKLWAILAPFRYGA